MTEILFKEESYRIVGIIYKVYNDLGYGYQEKYYYRPIKDELMRSGFSVKEQLLTPLLYNDKSIGRYYLDFLINGCIILEIKVANQVYPRYVKQVLGYLKSNKIKLGIIAVLNKDGVIIKRVLNER
jgi:GxxExxY protein